MARRLLNKKWVSGSEKVKTKMEKSESKFDLGKLKMDLGLNFSKVSWKKVKSDFFIQNPVFEGR